MFLCLYNYINAFTRCFSCALHLRVPYVFVHPHGIEPRSRPVPSYVTLLDCEDQVLRRFPRRRAGEDRFRPDYCPLYVLYSRTAFRRLGPPDLDRTFASPTLGEAPNFSDFRGYSRESVFAVLTGPGWVMRSGEPCWLVVCSLRDVFREMVYDPRWGRSFLAIVYAASLRSHLTCNMDMEYSYAIAPYRVGSTGRVIEDYNRRWLAFDLGNSDYLTLRAVGRYPALSSFVARKEEKAQRNQDDEADSPPPEVTSPSTPTTSVGGSPPDAPEALEPLERPRRRRRIGPPSLPSPTPPDSPEEAQSPSAPANNDSAGGVADSLEGAAPFSSH
ncbi:hypothetical protein Emag_007638 [Eimeria magna]